MARKYLLIRSARVTKFDPEYTTVEILIENIANTNVKYVLKVKPVSPAREEIVKYGTIGAGEKKKIEYVTVPSPWCYAPDVKGSLVCEDLVISVTLARTNPPPYTIESTREFRFKLVKFEDGRPPNGGIPPEEKKKSDWWKILLLIIIGILILILLLRRR